MYIDPEGKRYTGTSNFAEDFDDFRERYNEAKEEGLPVVAQSEDKVALKKLQDDLRKLEYRKIFKQK